MRITGLTTQAASSAADDFEDQDGTNNGSRKIAVQDKHGQFRNALPPLQTGIFLQGGSASPITIRDNVQFSYGTHDCAFDIWVALPTWAPAADRLIFCKYDGTSKIGIKAWLLTSGKLRLQIGNGTDFTTYQYDSTVATPAYPAWYYVDVNASLTRAGNLIWSLNGVQLGAGVDISAAVAQTITNTGSIIIGGDGASSKTIMAVKKFSPFNDALTATDVTEIFLLGGEIPYRFQYATEDNVLIGAAGDFSSSSSGWSIANGTTTLDSNTTVAGKLYALQAASGLFRIQASANVYNGLKHRVSLKARLNSGAGGTLKIGKSSFDSAGDRLLIVPTGAETTFTGVIGLGNTTEGTNITTGGFQIWADSANSSAYEFDDIVLTRIGATAHYRFDEGGGLVAADSSGNAHGQAYSNPKANGAVLSPAGSTNPGNANWLSPNLTEQLIDALSSTNGNEQLFGAGIIDTCGGRLWIITRILVYAFTGTPTIKVGITSGGAEIVASVALSTQTWTDLTLLSGKTIIGAGAAVSMWINSSSTDKLSFKILGRPL